MPSPPHFEAAANRPTIVRQYPTARRCGELPGMTGVVCVPGQCPSRVLFSGPGRRAIKTERGGNIMQQASRLIFTAAFVAAAAFSGMAQAAGYPERPIRMIVPFAPGGASDFVGRIFQDRLGAELGP